MPGLRATSSPATAAVEMAIFIAGSRPIRSASHDQGRTERATPQVATDSDSAACDAVICRSVASVGSKPCGA